MSQTLTIIVSIFLGLHGLIHLIGTVVYMQLAEIEGFSYKTTLLGGRLDLGDRGMRIFGLLWILPVVGFIAVAVALLAGWGWWQPALIGTTLFSLVLTSLDWGVAKAGAIINVVVLVALWLWPRFGL